MDGNNKVKKIAKIAIFSCILFIQEELLTALPNIQLTQLLITVYFFAFGYIDTLFIILIYVFLDNIVMGSFSIIFTPIMLVGWILLPTMLLTTRKNNNRIFISTIVLIHAFIYSMLFVIASVIMYKVDFKVYYLTDLPFEIILAFVGFISTFFLNNKLVDLLNRLNKKED